MKNLEEIKEFIANGSDLSSSVMICIEMAARIKQIRENAEISQAELSQYSDISEKSISRIENGLSLSSVETLYKLITSLSAMLHLDIDKKEDKEVVELLF